MLFTLRLSTTPTRSLIRYAIFSQTWPSRQIDRLVPLWEYRSKESMYKSIHKILLITNSPAAGNLASRHLTLF